MAQETLQKQILGTVTVQVQRMEYSQLGKLKLLILLTTVGVLGRVAFQGIPSVEPLTPLAILTGMLLGPVHGFIAGATGFYASNFFVVGWQGPWTLFQSLGAGLAGAIGGLFSFGIMKRWKIIVATVLGVVVFEAIVTVGGSLLFLGLLPIYILTSLPFSLTHLVSSLGFSLFSFEFRSALKKIGGRLIEQEVRVYRAVTDPFSKRGYRLVSHSRKHTKRSTRKRSRHDSPRQ